MLRFPKRFRVPKAYRHPRFLLLPATPAQAVVEFVAMLREREQLHQLFARTIYGPPPTSA